MYVPRGSPGLERLGDFVRQIQRRMLVVADDAVGVHAVVDRVVVGTWFGPVFGGWVMLDD